MTITGDEMATRLRNAHEALLEVDYLTQDEMNAIDFAARYISANTEEVDEVLEVMHEVGEAK